MLQPNNSFRYRLTDQIGELITSPLGEAEYTIAWERQQEDGKRYFTKNFGGKIVFTGGAYSRLLSFEQSIYRCVFQNISIERSCIQNGGAAWVEVFSGRISLNNGEWDLDKCQVTIQFDKSDIGECFEDNKSTELDIFSKVPTSSRKTLNLYDLSISLEYVNYSDTTDNRCNNEAYYWNGPGTPDEGRWTPYRHFFETEGTTSCTKTTYWARQVTTVACEDPAPGGDWVLVADTCSTGGNRKYARYAITYGCTNTTEIDGSRITSDYKCEVYGDVSTTGSTLPNAAFLYDAINAFVQTYCPGLTLKSDFFQWNPDNVSTVNYVTLSESKVRFLFVLQKSDVKRPTALNRATVMKWTFEKAMKALKYLFNVEWTIEDDIFRLEHVTYYTRDAGFDLTQPEFAKYVKGKRIYSYTNDKIPKREIWTFEESRGTGDFPGLPIIYSGGCVTSDSTDTTYAIEDLITDVELCLGNPDSDSSIVSDQGVVLVATTLKSGSYSVIMEDGILDESRINNSLAIAQLHRDYHRYERPLSSGNMNGYDTTFFSTLPTKKGVTIAIPLTCEMIFDPMNTITTGLGVGIVDTAKFNLMTRMLELELLYQANDNLTPNTAPVAGNDTATVFINSQIEIDVLANDSDADYPDDYISAVMIINPPLHGTAYVNSLNHVMYTPAAGYTGSDLMTYAIKDKWGAVSNTALISITVRPENTGPVAVNDTYTAYVQNLPFSVNAPGVFANDSDDDGFTLQSYDATTTLGGSVVVNTNGSFTYNHTSPTVGTNDTFTYTIVDSFGLTATATVTIQLRNNSIPVAVPDSYSTTMNVTLPGNASRTLTTNDYTPDGGTYTYTCTVENKATAQGGTVIIIAAGRFTYYPPTNFVGTDTFTYTVSNGVGSAVGTVTMNVLPVIYVKLVASNDVYHSVSSNCPGQGTVLLGSYRTRRYTLYYYSNSAGTIPYDVTGLGLVVNVVENYTISGTPGTITSSIDATGTSQIWANEKTYNSYYTDCDGNVEEDYNATFSLGSGNYQIL